MLGGLLRSEYKGAVYDLRWWLMDVAQLSKPRQDCRAFLSAFLQARRACICSAAAGCEADALDAAQDAASSAGTALMSS